MYFTILYKVIIQQKEETVKRIFPEQQIHDFTLFLVLMEAYNISYCVRFS